VIRFSPVLTAQTTYPFVRVEEAKRRLAADGVRIIDFGVGDPHEKTDARIRAALADAIEETSRYPRAPGLPVLREAIAGWCERRFGVRLDPDSEVIPTLGSKEAIFGFAQLVVDERGGKDVVVTTQPGYPVQDRGALFARAELVRLPLLERHGFLPDLDALPHDLLPRISLFWVNYPNNPTGATAPLEFYERLVALAEEHDFLVASDEAYSELWFDEPPRSALEVADRGRVVVFNTLSKRSSMTGYRSGFVAAAPAVIDALRRYRPTVGTTPQEFVQRASIVAWRDEEHVEQTRANYRAKRDLFVDLFARKGIRVAGGAATMYLWLETPPGETSESFAGRLLQRGVVLAPGSYLGEAGEGYVRLALVPTIEECRDAIEILEEVL
jgi:succinyldiaminopimelate transaminase